MAQIGGDGGQFPAAPAGVQGSGPPPVLTDSNGTGSKDGGMLAQALGTLGLLEVWVFIVYVFGNSGFEHFEGVILGALAAFEFLGRMPGMLALCLVCNNSTSIDHPENIKTITRDQLHNMVYPRDLPRSRKRRDFAAMALYGMLIAVVPVVILLSFFPTWTSLFDEPVWMRVVPSVLAVVAVIESMAGSAYMDANQSCFVLTVMYAHTKIMSLFLLVCGANRLLLGEEGEDGGGGGGVMVLGIPLAILQLIKVASAGVAAVNYLRGRPDEGLPTLRGTLRLCAFCPIH
ncbi:unnamed protein product [Ectocarpus sp. 6 AP-2014]